MQDSTLNKFLQVFFPDESETVHLRGIYPDKKRPSPVNFETTRRRISGDKDFQQQLVRKNKTHGLYFVVNAGGAPDVEISRFNAVFCEIDGAPGDFAAQHKLYDECGLPPSVRIETYKSVHVYWLLNGCESMERWRGVQMRLINRFGADDKIKNESRVMRLPFFKHIRIVNGNLISKKVLLHTFEPSRRYSWTEIEKHFPPIIERTVQPVYSKNFNNSEWDSINEELRLRISQHPTYRVEGNRHHATARGICHNGEGRTALTVDLRSGAVFCQKKCSYDAILSAFGLSRPERKTKIEYVERKKQSSNFYLWFKESQKQKSGEAEQQAE